MIKLASSFYKNYNDHDHVKKDLIPYARKRLAQKIAGITILGGGLLWLAIYAMRLVRKKEMTRR